MENKVARTELEVKTHNENSPSDMEMSDYKDLVEEQREYEEQYRVYMLQYEEQYRAYMLQRNSFD